MRILRQDLSITLVEARRKRTSFLSTVKRELGLGDVEVLAERAEDALETTSGLESSFDVVVSRSVGGSVLGTASRYLRAGGLYLAGASELGVEDRKPLSGSWLSLERKIVRYKSRSRVLLVGRKI